MPELLRTTALEAGYGDLRVLRGVDFSVAPGETVALVGPNGCGKSTLFKVLVGLLPLCCGEIRFRGGRLEDQCAERRIRRGLAYCPQRHNVFGDLSVEDNLLLSAWGVRTRDFAARRSIVLDAFPELAGTLNTRAGLLSGGQRQCLAVGMTLMKDACLYLFDELTAGLSPAAARSACEVVRAAQRSRGSALVLIEHNLQWLSGWVDRTCTMRQGRVVEEQLDKGTGGLYPLHVSRGSRPEEGGKLMKKVKYVKPKVVGTSSVHPC